MKKLMALMALALPMVLVSCIPDDPYVGPPTVVLSQSPKNGAVTPKDDVTITATVTDNYKVVSVDLYYTVNDGAEVNVAMAADSTGDNYIGVIPAQANESKVSYYVVATNEKDKTATTDKGSYTVSEEVVEYAGIKDIIISEVNCATKYIEIYNPTDRPADISGLHFAKNGTNEWFINADGPVTVANGTILEAGAYGVMGCKSSNPADFAADGALNLGISTSGLSGSKSVLVVAQDADGNNYDYFVNIAESGHSPNDACWDGAYEVDFSTAGGSVSRFNENGKWVWYVTEATPGAANVKPEGAVAVVNTVDFGAQPAANIANLGHTPAAPTYENEVSVTAEVLNASAVKLTYGFDNDYTTVDMTASPAAVNLYIATIPAYAAGTIVYYYVTATGLDGQDVKSDEKNYTVMGEVTTYDYSKLVLNELNGNAKYVEIYNAGDMEVDLAGCILRKDNDENNDFTIPSCKVAAGAYQVIACSGYSGAGVDLPASPNGLSAKKALSLELLDPDKNSVDKFETDNTFEVKVASYSRVPDATGAWYYAAPSEGAANGISTGVIGSKFEVYINELSGTDKQMELYNATDADITLTGYTIEKDEEVKWTGTDEVVPAKGYLVLTFNKKGSGSGVITCGFSGGKSVSVVLKNADGKAIDAFLRGKPAPAWGDQTLTEEATYSFSRMDFGKWSYAAPTLGAANGEATGDIANN